MKTAINNNAGFTLLEVIASLVIMSIVALVAAMGLVSGVRAYVTTRINAETLQRAEYAINRIKLEFMNMDSITSASDSSISFTSDRTNRGTGTVYMFTYTNGQIALNVGVSSNPLITGLVAGQAFLTYRDKTGGAWTTGQGFNALHTITIQLVIPRPDGGENFVLTTSVNPRNNGLANGPQPVSTGQ